MRVLVKRPSVSIGGAIRRNGDIAEVSEEEFRKKSKRYPDGFEVLPEEVKPAPKKRGRPKKKAAENE